jgi:hypothetical protein
LSEAEIQSIAAELAAEYGVSEAQRIAAKRAHALAAQHDMDGFTDWTQIIMLLIGLEERRHSAPTH